MEDSDKYSNDSQNADYYDEEEDFTQPYNKKVTSSVQEFLKQSSEIQQEIKKLSELCQQISPKKESFIQEESPEKEDFEDPEYEQSVMWDDINKLLKTHGLTPLVLIKDKFGQEQPEAASLKDAVIELTTEFSNLDRRYNETVEAAKDLEHQVENMKKHREKCKVLENKLKETEKNYKSLLEKKRKEEPKTLPRLKIVDDKSLNTFKAFLQKDFLPNKESHSRVMALIQSYEEKLKKTSSELSNYKRDLQNLSHTRQNFKEKSFEDYEKKIFKENDVEIQEKNKVLQKITSNLKLKSFTDLPSAIEKIQKVMSTLPILDKFVKEVCEEISSGSAGKFNEVLDEIRLIKHQKYVLEKFRQNVTEFLIVDSEEEAYEKIKSLMYFCKLFEVKPQDDLIESIEGVFFFVHEIKLFLNHCRRALAIRNEYGVKIVLEEVLKCVQGYS